MEDIWRMCQLALVAGSCSALGCFVVTKRDSMLANAMTHTILLGYVVTFFCVGPMITSNFWAYALGGWLSLVCTTLSMTWVEKLLPQKKEAAIGLVFTTFFAIGTVAAVFLTPQLNFYNQILMGDLDGTEPTILLHAVWFGILVSSIVLGRFRWPMWLFDPHGLQIYWPWTGQLGFLYSLLMATTLMLAFFVLGAFVPLLFMVGNPILTRPFVTHWGAWIVYAVVAGWIEAVLAVAAAQGAEWLLDVRLSTSGLCAVSFLLVALFAVQQRNTYNGANSKE